MKLQSIILLLLACSLWSVTAGAQSPDSISYDLEPIVQRQAPEKKNDVYILAKSSATGIDIRWAPTNLQTWNTGITHGYRLERMALNADTVFTKEEYNLVGAESVKPWPLAEWKEIVNDDRPHCAVAAMAIYGEEKTEAQGFVEQSRDQNNRLGFNLLAADLDRDAAIASGMRYQAIGTLPEESGGMYRVFAYDPLSGISSDTAYVLAVHTGATDIEAPVMVDSISYENALAIRWYNNAGQRAFSGFHIERSTDGRQFERITQRPFLNAVTALRTDNNFITYIDSVDQNNVMYHYRVIGIDAFGDESPPSDIQLAMAYDDLPTQSVSDLMVEQKGEDALVINWTLPNNLDQRKVRGLNIYKSIDVNETFELLSTEILPITATSFTDENPDPRETNYYYVTIVDIAGNEVKSAPTYGFTKDDTPPQPPTRMRADIDTTGAVLIEWDAPADRDIRGYRIFWSYEKDGEFAVKPGKLLPNPYFVDQVQLKSLTEDIYYYVLAVDYSYNRSEASEVFLLQKPDIIPPEASIFADYAVSENGIQIEWIRSTSTDVEQVVLERNDGARGWVEMQDFDQNVLTYRDTEVKGGTLYQYRLATIDDAGNITYNKKPLTLEALTPFFIPTISNLKIEKVDDQIQLQWEHPDNGNVSYIIYRQRGDNQWQTTKITKASTYTLTSDDKSIYAIKARAKDGRESEMSKSIRI